MSPLHVPFHTRLPSPRPTYLGDIERLPVSPPLPPPTLARLNASLCWSSSRSCSAPYMFPCARPPPLLPEGVLEWAATAAAVPAPPSFAAPLSSFASARALLCSISSPISSARETHAWVRACGVRV